MTATTAPAAHAALVEEPAAVPLAPEAPQAESSEVVEDLLVEDVSIDGMCGVY